MLAKLITHADTRDAARLQMMAALDSYVIEGINPNLNFLRAVMENQAFVEGRYSTKFIPEQYPSGFHGYEFSSQQNLEAAAYTAVIHALKQYRASQVSGSHISSFPEDGYMVTLGNRVFAVSLQPAPWASDVLEEQHFLSTIQDITKFKVDPSSSPEEILEGSPDEEDDDMMVNVQIAVQWNPTSKVVKTKIYFEGTDSDQEGDEEGEIPEDDDLENKLDRVDWDRIQIETTPY